MASGSSAASYAAAQASVDSQLALLMAAESAPDSSANPAASPGCQFIEKAIAIPCPNCKQVFDIMKYEYDQTRGDLTESKVRIAKESDMVQVWRRRYERLREEVAGYVEYSQWLEKNMKEMQAEIDGLEAEIEGRKNKKLKVSKQIKVEFPGLN